MWTNVLYVLFRFFSQNYKRVHTYAEYILLYYCAEHSVIRLYPLNVYKKLEKAQMAGHAKLLQGSKNPQTPEG